MMKVYHQTAALIKMKMKLILTTPVIVDVTISDTNALGRTFWKQSFKKDDEILEVSLSARTRPLRN